MSQAFHLNNITLAESTGKRDNGFPHYLYDISTTSMNSQSFHISKETLGYIAEQADAGVPIYKDHNTYFEDPAGYTVSARLSRNKVKAELYIQPNLTEPDTNQMIARMDAGTMRDGSISFLGGDFHSSAPGGGLFKMKSDGWFYSFVDEKGNHLGQELENGKIVTAEVRGKVNLREFSITGRGADPGAGIVKKLHEEFGSEPIDIGVINALSEINGFDMGVFCQHLGISGNPENVKSFSIPDDKPELSPYFIPTKTLQISDRKMEKHALEREALRAIHEYHLSKR